MTAAVQPKTRLIVVEDEILVARDLQDRLTEMGYEVPEIAGTGAEALDLVERFRPDLVLMDVRIRGRIDGVETAERIRESHGTPVVYLTAYADDTTVSRAKITEPFGYILKPFQERELETTIEIALYRHNAERRLRQAHAGLARQLRELQARDRLVQAQMRGVTAPEARDLTVDVVMCVLDPQQVVFYEADGGLLRPVAAQGLPDGVQVGELPPGPPLAVQAAAELEPRCSDDRRECAVPVLHGDDVLGVVWARDDGGCLGEDAPYTFWRLCQQAAVILRPAPVTA